MKLLFYRFRQLVCTAVIGAVLPLSACGAWQSTKDTTRETTHAIFISKVKTMNLAIEGRAELNDDRDGAALPLKMRIYQLRDAQAFEKAAYDELLHGSDSVKADVLYRTDATLGPSQTLALKTPMADPARFVGIVAFFRNPSKDGWRLVIPRAQWKKTDPVHITVIDNRMQQENDR